MERKKLTREQVEQIVKEARERGERPDLSRANLSGTDLSGANLTRITLNGTDFREADLSGASLSWVNLSKANLSKANLTGATLSGANLSEVDLNGATLIEANLIGANLSGADLSGAVLSGAKLGGANLTLANLISSRLIKTKLSKANLTKANLTGANLTEVNLFGADLNGATLIKATLVGVNLTEANLNEADLSGADLKGAILTRAKLDRANFRNAVIDSTNFIGVDLSQVKGLTDIRHDGPSAIDINTIYQSKDKIPKVFLEKAGVHPDIIRWQHSLHTRPTVFISYSHQDEKEKDELLVHLRALEREDLITVWHDELIGAGTDWKQEIKQAIGQASVAILLITPHFLASEFIQEKEIPEFLRRRESEEALIIFPIIAKQCAWPRVGWLAEMQVRPKGGQPIWDKSQDKDTDTELALITDEVIEIIKDRWLR